MIREIPIKKVLASIYGEVMWLAKRPSTTSSEARGWYTHVVSGRLARRVRRFTGMVSRKALRKGASLRLEHFKRIQTMLTQLVERHRRNRLNRPSEFIRLVLDSEQVHIVTRIENYSAMKAKGNYKAARIKLVRWKQVPQNIRKRLWSRMLRGRVANATKYASK